MVYLEEAAFVFDEGVLATDVVHLVVLVDHETSHEDCSQVGHAVDARLFKLEVEILHELLHALDKRHLLVLELRHLGVTEQLQLLLAVANVIDRLATLVLVLHGLFHCLLKLYLTRLLIQE